jgi:Uma2 family endonuclease
MSTTTTQRPASGRRLARLSVEKYEAMIASGAFTKCDRLELIEGNLVEKMTQNPPHSVTVGLSDDLIRAALPAGWHTRQEKPVRIPSRDSMPEPDVSVIRGQRADWLQRHPGPADVALVVEVADSSVEDDRAMAPTYGGGGVSVYWIVNVRDRQLEVYSGPSGPSEPLGYRHCEVLLPGDVVPLMLEGREVARIPVADLLPRAGSTSS